MYKILNTRGLGIGGRQNELIELALTYKFDGVEIDMEDLLGRHDALGKEFACQFLKSAKQLDLGTFRLPINFGSSEEAFKKAIGKIETILSLADELGAKRCYVELETNSPTDSFQENFDTHKTRLAEVAAIFATHDIKMGVYLKAVGATDVEGQFKFIQTAEEVLTLVKTIGNDNLGVCLDLFEWQAGGGTVDQIKALLASNSITEVRLADLNEGADASSVTKADRVAVPASEQNSVSYQVVQLLIAAGYDGAVSASTDSVSFTATVVIQCSKKSARYWTSWPRGSIRLLYWLNLKPLQQQKLPPKQAKAKKVLKLRLLLQQTLPPPMMVMLKKPLNRLPLKADRNWL